jgi:SOS-response transcriptional repressor LexA
MAYGKISSKQREILEYIKQEILNKGYPPAVREICEAVHLKSTSSLRLLKRMVISEEILQNHVPSRSLMTIST